MNTDLQMFLRTVQALKLARGGDIGPCSGRTLEWCANQGLPEPIRQLLQDHAPKTEIWAGAGAIFDEARIVSWNEDFPEALRDKLLIVGSAGNGDHIAIDLIDGSTGYICHETQWRLNPRSEFVAVSPSLGKYIRDINQGSTDLPPDYWKAREVTASRDGSEA